MTKHTAPLSLSLYERDETAWLETTADLVAHGRFGEVDRAALAEYLIDMAKRDKREVKSRLSVLIAHLLKWQYQPRSRTNSWRGTIVVQRRELGDLLESETLRAYAEEVLGQCYAGAVKQAAAESGLAVEKFSRASPYSLDWLLSDELPAK